MISTNFISIRVAILPIIILFLLFTLSCKKDPISSAPLTAVATSTIGTSGGVLETADFSLKVPAGSFASEATLNLYISPDPSSFGDNSLSQSFMVDGLPELIEKPIRISLKYNGTLSDSSYIAYGDMTTDFFTGDSSIVYQFISAKDSAGFLVGFLTRNFEQGGGKINKLNVANTSQGGAFGAVSGYKVFDTENFLIKFSNFGWTEGTIQNFGNLCETTLDRIKNEIGFKYHLRKNCKTNSNCWDWPIEIIIKDVEDKLQLRYSINSDWGYLGPYLNIDGTIVDSPIGSETQDLIGRALLEISLITYVMDENWLEFATIDWFEGYFDNTSNLITPSNFQGNEYAPFKGIENYDWKNGKERKAHGNGMVSVIKYLKDYTDFNVTKLVSIFETIHSKPYDEPYIHPVTVLLNSVGALIADWWPNFFEHYVKGDIYGVPISVFTSYNYLDGTWNIDSENNTSETFNMSYFDLSAKRFIINLNYSDVDPDASLYLEAIGNSGYDGVATLVFGLNSNLNVEHLVTAKNKLAVLPKKLKEYYDSDIRQFLVVVVNSTHNATNYLRSSNIELKMEVKKEVPALYTTCEVEVKYRGNFHDVVDIFHPNGTDTDTTMWRNYGFTFVDTYSGGSFTGNTYTYDYVRAFDNGNTHDIHFTLTLSDDKSEITNIEYSYYSRFDGNAGHSENIVYHNLASIPLEQVDAVNNEATYYIGGAETCNSITNVSSSYDHLTFDTYTSTKDLLDYMCDENSYITVKLK